MTDGSLLPFLPPLAVVRDAGFRRRLRSVWRADVDSITYSVIRAHTKYRRASDTVCHPTDRDRYRSPDDHNNLSPDGHTTPIAVPHGDVQPHPIVQIRDAE